MGSTELLASRLARLSRKPRVLISASAVGWYGDRGDELLREDDPGPARPGFLARVARAWEAATAPAAAAGVRVVHLRQGMVLASDGGALSKITPIFRLGLGGRLGRGHQWMSWIALPDLLSSIHHILTADTLQGPVNAVSPEPVTNAAFTAALGRALHRPAILPVPAPILKLLLGTMGKELLLASARVLPMRLEQSGFTFRFPTLPSALEELLG